MLCGIWRSQVIMVTFKIMADGIHSINVENLAIKTKKQLSQILIAEALVLKLQQQKKTFGVSTEFLVYNFCCAFKIYWCLIILIQFLLCFHNILKTFKYINVSIFWKPSKGTLKETSRECELRKEYNNTNHCHWLLRFLFVAVFLGNCLKLFLTGCN